MATPAQVGGAAVGAGSLAAAGGYGITYYVKSDSTEEEAEPTSVKFQTSDLSTLTGKVLNVFKDENLLKLVKATDENNKWWDWAFKNKYQVRNLEITFDSSFSNLKDSSALKNSCERAYKQDRSKFQDLALSIAAFCTEGTDSLDLSEPRVTFYSGSVEGYTNGLLSVDENKSKLVKTSITEQEKTTIFNDLWWNWAYKNFLENKKENISASFNTVDKGYNDTDTKALNKACDEAHKKPYADLKNNNWQLLNEIKKFCSLNKESTDLLLPEPASPTFVTETTSYSDTNALAKKGDNKGKLVAPANNENWWEWSFNRNYPKDKETKAKLPDPFKHITTHKTDASGTENQQTGLNYACDEAYKKSKTPLESKVGTDGKTAFEWVKILCSPPSSSSNLALPDA